MAKIHDDVWSRMSPDALPGDLRDIALSLGMDVARRLCEDWDGTQIYIPRTTSVTRDALDEVVRDARNGRNEGELARRYGISRRHVYDALKRSRGADPAQGALFDGD